MKKTRIVPLRLPENLDDLAALSAQEQHTDKATALRQWIHLGAGEYVLRRVAEGKTSIGRAAELLGSTVYEVQYLAEKLGVEIGATEEQQKRSWETAERLQSAKAKRA